jgi:hypothetical protein
MNMEQFLDLSKYTVYKLKTDDTLLVAVPILYSEQISDLLKEHGKLENVPSSKTVRGIFIKNDHEGKNPEMMKVGEQENDVTVNQLVAC